MMNLGGNRLNKLHIVYLLTVVLFIFSIRVQAEAGNLDQFKVVAENPYLSLLIKKETAEIAIRDKTTGVVWFSNPPAREIMEKKMQGRAKDALNSQLSINYYDQGDRLFVLDTYNDSIKNDQYKIIPIEQGVRVEFQLGKKWMDEDYIPNIVSQEKFETEILNKISLAEDREFLLEQYYLINLVEKEGDEQLEIFGVDMQKLFGNYQVEVVGAEISERDRRRLIQDLLKKIVAGKSYSGLGEVKRNDLSPLFNNSAYLLKSNVRAWDLPKLISLIMEVGYTPEEIQVDHKKYNFRPPWPNIRVFELAIEYLLDSEDLVVRVPGDSIKYPINVFDNETKEIVSFPMTEINVMEYFTSGDESEEGYLFVPDGSGALIYLNSGKIKARPYNKEVYGKDYAVRPLEEYSPYLDEQIYMPVFGLKKKDQAILAIIEKGESLANIRAEVAGMRDSYNKVYPCFTLIPRTQVKLKGDLTTGDLSKLQLNMYQTRKYQGDIIIRYKLLTGTQTDYSDMARSYQQYLVEKHGLQKLTPQPRIPFFLELLGGINKTIPVMGVPQRIIEPLTTYQQALTILGTLARGGITNVKLKYTGWSEGGVKHSFPSKPRLEKKLGSKKDFMDLINYNNKEYELFPDISFLNVYNYSWFKGFNSLRDTARFLSREAAFIYDKYDIATYQAVKKEKRYIYSPSRLGWLVTGFMCKYEQYQIPGISLRFMGKQLNSDFQVKQDRLRDREQVKEILEKELIKISQDYQKNILLDGGNFFAIPYARYILNVPMYSDAYTILDEGIPFLQMVLHGYYYYTGEPINLAQKPKNYLLKLIETGACPYYKWSYKPSSVVKKTNFDDQYSIYYKAYLQEAEDLYNKMNSLLAQVQDKRIIKHEKLEENVYKTTYEDGKEVIVNYNQEAVEVAEQMIEGTSFKMIWEGE